MKTATIYCGITSAMRELGMHDAERLIDTHLTEIAAKFGGYTKQVCTGGWVDAGGKLVTDTTKERLNGVLHYLAERGQSRFSRVQQKNFEWFLVDGAGEYHKWDDLVNEEGFIKVT